MLGSPWGGRSGGVHMFKITTDTTDRDLVLKCTFDVSPRRVFQAFQEPDHLVRWWGPKGWQIELSRFDCKPGGVWHYRMRCVDQNQPEFYGQESWRKAIYHEVAEPKRLVYMDFFADEEGEPMEGMPELLVTLTFAEQEGKTLFTNRTHFPSRQSLETTMDMGLVQEMAETWKRLAEYLRGNG
jgi:uncharacterized protein YndB with AHSA1/START domain